MRTAVVICSTMKRLRFGWFCAIFLIQSPAGATEYYFDSVAGADHHPGTRIDAPLRSLAALARLPLKPGDVVHFRRGCTWRGQLNFQGNGTADKPIRLTAYGEGPKPEFLATIRIDGWQLETRETYRATIPAGQFVGDPEVNGVFLYPEKRVPLRLAKASGIPSKRGTYHFDRGKRLLYVILPDRNPPASEPLEVSVVTPLVDLTGRSWIEMDGLAFLFGGRNHWRLSRCTDVTVRNCAALFVGDKNPAVVITDHSERVRIEGCFIYDCVNNGVKLNQGATHCVVSGCTISKLATNDGVTCHDGPPAESGDYNIVENNVISFCGENSVDITSGDHHFVRGNICYRDTQSDIQLGHGADHILVQNNICFGAKRSGILLGGNPAEGFRGGNRVCQNLIFDCGYPGIEIGADGTQVLNNTIVNSRDRPGIRLSRETRQTVLRNNLVAILDPAIPHSCLQFLQTDPRTAQTTIDHNLFYHAGRQDRTVSAWVGTRHEDLAPAELARKYDAGSGNLAKAPKFSSGAPRCFLAPDSPCVDAGVDAGLPFSGRAPDIGWKEVGREGESPRFPEVMIESPEDYEAVMYLWGKTTRRPKRP